MYSVADLLASHGFRSGRRPTSGSSSSTQPPLRMEPPRSGLEQGFPGQDVWHDAPPAPRATRHSSLPLQEHPARAEPSRERAELVSEKANYEEGQMQHQSPPVTIRNFENQLPLLEGSDESVSYWRRRGQDFSVLLDYTNHQPPHVDVSPPAYLAGLRDQPPSYNTVQHGPFNQTAVSREANPPPYPAVSRDSTLPSEYSGLHGYPANAEAIPRPSTYPQPPPYKAEPPTLELSQNSAPQTTQLQQSKINPDYALLTDQSKNMHRNSREKVNSKYVSSHCCSDYQDMSGMYYSSSQCGQDSKDMLVNPGKGSTSLQATSDAHAILYTGKQYFEATPLPTEKIEKPQTFRPPPPTYEMYQMRSKDCYKGPTTQVQLKNLCCHTSTHENGQYKSSAEFSPDRFMPPESQMKYQNVQLPTYIKPPDYISQYKENTSHQNQHASNENSIDSTGENKQKLRTARVEYIPFTDPRVRIVPKAHWETERQNQDNGHSVRKSTNDNNSVNYIQVKEGLDKQLLYSKQISPPSLVLPVLNQDSYVWRNSQSNHEINKHKMHSDDITYMQLKYPDSTSTSADHAFHSRKGHIQETASEHRSVLHTDKKEGILQGDKTHEASGGQMPRSLLGVRTGVHQRGAVGETVFCLISVPSQSVDVDQGGIWLPDVSNGSSNTVPEHSHQHTQSASELELQALTGKMIAEEEARKAKEKAEEKAKKHACESQILSHPLKFSSELKGEAKMYDTRQKPLSQKHQLNNVTLHCVPKQLYPDERTFVSQKNRQIHGHAVEVEGKHFQASNCRWKTQNSQNTSHITGETKNEEIKSEFGSKINGKQIQILKEGNTKVGSKGNKSCQNRETGKRGTNCGKEKFNSKYFYKVKSLKEPTGTHSQAAIEANTQVPTITLKGNSLADSFSFGQFLLRPVGRRPWDVVSELENINRELQDDPEEQDHDPSIRRPQDVYQRFHVLMPSGQKDELTHTLERRKSEPNLSELPSSQYERSHIAWGSKNSRQNVGDYSSPYSSDGSTTNKVEIDDDDGNEQNRIKDNLEKENLHFHQKGPSERLLHYNRSHGNDVYMSTPSSTLQRRHGHSEPDLTALIASQELGDEHEDQSEFGFTSTSLKESLAERAARILGISISEDALLAPDNITATESKDALTMEFDGNFCDITTGTEKATHNSNNLFGENKLLFINGYSDNEQNETSKHGLQIKNKCDSHKDKLNKSRVIICKDELTSYTSTKLYESHTQEEMSPPKYANGNQPDRKTDDENTIRNQVICASGDQYNCNITGCITEPRFYSSCSMIFSPIKMKSENTIHVKHIEQSKSPLIVENVCSMKGECEDCSDIPGCLCLVKDDGFVDSLSKHERRDRQLNECNRMALAEHAKVAWEYTDKLKAAASDSIKDNGHGLDDVHGCLPLHVPTVKTNTEATNTLLAVDVICS